MSSPTFPRNPGAVRPGDRRPAMLCVIDSAALSIAVMSVPLDPVVIVTGPGAPEPAGDHNRIRPGARPVPPDPGEWRACCCLEGLYGTSAVKVGETG
jgi:hypothetical protein